MMQCDAALLELYNAYYEKTNSLVDIYMPVLGTDEQQMLLLYLLYT